MNALSEGVREGKKAKTRAAIRQHALRLFREQVTPRRRQLTGTGG
jgi:hypothetical protein